MVKETNEAEKEDEGKQKPRNIDTVAVAEGKKRYRKEVTRIIALIVPIAIVAGYIANSFLVLSMAIGSVGGIVHDLIQNKGLVVYPVSTTEGIYLGLAIGALLGAVSGFMACATIATPYTIDVKSLVIPLTWGLGLKGLIDGAMNTVTSDLKTKP